MDHWRRLLIEVAWEALGRGRPASRHSRYANLIRHCAACDYVRWRARLRPVDLGVHPNRELGELRRWTASTHPRGTRTRGDHVYGLLIVVGGRCTWRLPEPARRRESDMALGGWNQPFAE